MSWSSKLMYGGGAVFVVGTLAFAAVMMKQAHAHVVLFENSLDTAGELRLNGKSYGLIAPRRHLRVELDATTYTVEFQGAAGMLDQGDLVVKDLADDMTGFRALYNLGGRKGLAVVTMTYGHDTRKHHVAPVPEGTRLVEVPHASLDDVDGTFPDRMTVKPRLSSLTRVCHIDEQTKKLGCPGL
jgi:hypothetical protein